MRRAILAAVAALCCAPGHAATLSRLPSAPVPALRGPLTAPSFRAGLGPVLLAAPLAAPTLSPSSVLPQLQPTPAVPAPAAQDIPEILITPVSPEAFGLGRLASFADSLPRLAAQDLGPALDAFWNGAQARKTPVQAEELSYLSVPRSADFQRLAGIVAAARESPTGRKILDAALALTKKEGRPIQVRFQELKGNLGEYDYLGRVLYLNRSYAEDEPSLGAATLVHELLHVLQHAEGVPSEALEMELEAHIVSLKVLDELGVPVGRDGSFSLAAARELRKSPQAYEEWMAGQLSGKLRLNQGFASAIDDLEAERDQLEDTVADLEETYDETGSAQARGRLARAQQSLGAVEADIKLLRSSAGRAAYRKLAARVQALMRSYHRTLAGRK
ncbi:MAG: hypothetical protein PHU21_01015 [Elusimicrobia bacterium]|nr:hypothetical protein [Elusimicrobiota bacterium]